MQTEAESSPKYKQIYEHLKTLILAGTYGPGDRLPTEAQLVLRFKASRTTVIRALRELEQHGLLSRRQGSGSYATSKAPTDRHLFGLIVPGVSPEQRMYSIFPALYDEMSSLSHDHGAGLLFGAYNGGGETIGARLLGVAEQMLAHRATGVFLVPQGLTAAGNDTNYHIARLLTEKGVPLVLLDRDIVDYPRRSEFDLVGVDNQRGGYLLTAHLLSLGCRRIAFVGEPQRASTISARVAGCESALQEHGIAIDPRWRWPGDFTAPGFARNLVRDFRPDAIVCSYDEVAAHLMRSLLADGVKIPQDVKIVGFDDTPASLLLPVPLTTIRQPIKALARAAIRFMFDRLEASEMPERHVLVGCELIVRQSTAG